VLQGSYYFDHKDTRIYHSTQIWA